MSGGRAAKTAALSLCVNLVYAAYTAALGVAGRSWWFVTLAAYYITLSVVRFAALLCAGRPESGANRIITRFTGVLFLFMAVTLAGTAYLSVLSERGIKHHEIVMITIALYAFVKITLAVVHLAKIKHTDAPALKTLRNISLADAAVSVFSLQRSMLVTFEGMSAADMRLMNMLTGTAVYLTVMMLGINLIGGKRVTMAKSKLAEANQKIAEGVVGGYKKVEQGVVSGYRKIEDGVVGGYGKLEDAFIDRFLTHDGESVEEARARLKGQQDDESK